MNNELFNDLYTASEYFKVCDTYMVIKQRFEQDEQACIEKYQQMKSQGNESINPKYISLASIGFGIFIALLSFAADNFLGVIFNLAFAFLFIFVIPKFAKRLITKMIKEHDREAENFWNTEGGYVVAEDRKNIRKATDELSKFKNENSHLVNFLPKDYHSYTATLYMANAVANGRADTLKEAINIFEEQLHRWEMENISREIASQNAYIQNQLQGIYERQGETNRTLKNIENLELYHIFQHM